MHVGTHDWLRYGDTYEGEPLPGGSPHGRPLVRLYRPDDPAQSIEVQASWVDEVS